MSATKPPVEPSTATWQRFLALGPVVWLATGGWVGMFPVMPGTVGSLWGIPLALALGAIPLPALQLGVIAVLAFASVPICTTAALRLGLKDPGPVVLDEIIALPVAYFLHPVRDPAVLVAGFLLFRFFDILKPPPVHQVERLPGGWGIMADDLVAAVYANLVLWLLTWAGLFTALARWRG